MPDKRDLILRATEKIIAARGLHGLSMQLIATEADVAAGTIYRYFTDKDELIIELRKDILAKLASFVLENCGEGTLEQKFKRIWLKMHNFARKLTPSNLSYEQYSTLPDSNTEDIKQLELEALSPLFELFDEGKEKGLFYPLNNRALYALSLEPAMTLARTIRRSNVSYTSSEIDLICHLCWQTIQVSSNSTPVEQVDQ